MLQNQSKVKLGFELKTAATWIVFCPLHYRISFISSAASSPRHRKWTGVARETRVPVRFLALLIKDFKKKLRRMLKGHAMEIWGYPIRGHNRSSC